MSSDATTKIPGSRWFRLASWLWIVTGIGHTIGNHGPLAPKPTPEELALAAVLQRTPLTVAAPLHRTWSQGMLGDSLSLGLMLFGFGLVQLLFERDLRRRGFGVPVSVVAAALIVTLVCGVITALCFPLQPLVGLGVMLVAYVMALRARLRAASEQPGAD